MKGLWACGWLLASKGIGCKGPWISSIMKGILILSLPSHHHSQSKGEDEMPPITSPFQQTKAKDVTEMESRAALSVQ